MTVNGSGATVTILLVESEPAVRVRLTASLTEAGFKVIETENTGEAWSALETRPDVKVLLADLDLPGADGLELAWRIHSRWPRLGLVITSGQIRHLHPEDVPGDGCFLPRPLPVNVLLQEIGAAARS